MDAQALGNTIKSVRETYTISRLNREAKLLLETGFPALWVEGEISNLARPTSGHLYFCLKDSSAQIRCALFRGAARLLAARPQDGMRVLVRARVTLYEGRGEFQLIVEHLEEAGEGALRCAFEALKARLAEEGLFLIDRKKMLPALPRRIGVITSPTGAALRDILTTLKRRFPAIPVLLYPVPVQGEGAAEKIADAIALASARADCDALIVARGGGSLEDLWPFNEEVVARALFACEIPVVSGVGHETDFTIADLVADIRAPTPTAAAELLSPDQSEWRGLFAQREERLNKLMRRFFTESQQHVDWLSTRLVRPDRHVQLARERLQGLYRRLCFMQSATRARAAAALLTQRAHLRRLSPQSRLRERRLQVARAREKLAAGMRARLIHTEQRWFRAAKVLNAVSPLATLERGYAIAERADNGALLRTAGQVRPGDGIYLRLARGRVDCRVEQVRDE
jgi:exodeoxyribonuclease VII large subunit